MDTPNSNLSSSARLTVSNRYASGLSNGKSSKIKAQGVSGLRV